MAINFTDSPANGATQVVGGRTYTYNSTKNKWDTTATEVTGPTATVYANVDALPTSGNITGAQAYVSGNNRLYIWNGTGWYNIALINTAPTISGVNAAYELATDGAPTSVVITATDPEGLPLTYSIVSDTSGDIATVTQGVGGNTDIFTITPSTNNAHAGTFSLTFRASDGVNVATAVAEFTLAFSVLNSKYTTALITSVGANNADNNDFVDSSGNSHTITAYGDVTQGSFSPFRQNGYSWQFDGTGDYLSAGDDATFELGSGDFTIETWVYLTGYSNSYSGYYSAGICGKDNTTTRSYSFQIGGTASSYTSLYFSMFVGGSPNATSYNTTFNLNQWYHIAVSRESGTLRMFIDGALVETNTSANQTPTEGSQPFVIGAGGTYSGYEYTLPGHLTDFRFVKGTAVYTAAFTPPTERVTAVTNTSLLLGNLPYLAEGSTNNHKLTSNGNVSMQPFTPYDNEEEYASSTDGGSIFFNGTNAYLRADTALDSMTSGDTEWTLEAWVYPNNLGGTGGTSEEFFGCNRTSDGHNVLTVGPKQLRVDATDYTNLTDLVAKQWSHVAVVYHRGYNGLRYYINGYHVNSYNPPASQPALADCAFGIGCEFDGSSLTPGNYFDGLMSDVRVSDHDIYGVSSSYSPTNPPTQEFTPPTAPLTATSDTDFLLHATNAGIIDKVQSVQEVLLEGVTSSTTQTKYLSSSMYFDGTNDYIRADDAIKDIVATTPFTMEAWVYPTAIGTTGSRRYFFAVNTLSAGGNILLVGPSNIGVNGGSDDVTDLSLNTWSHVAFVYDGSGGWKYYINGALDYTSSDTIALDAPSSFLIGTEADSANAGSLGNYFEGYLSDIRVTKGLQRYTANFTPPTAALQG